MECARLAFRSIHEFAAGNLVVWLPEIEIWGLALLCRRAGQRLRKRWELSHRVVIRPLVEAHRNVEEQSDEEGGVLLSYYRRRPQVS
eukprot:2973726-Prymnesium_polylepis.1